MSTCSCYLDVHVGEIMSPLSLMAQFWFNHPLVLLLVTFLPMHIKKASVGMYSGCVYPYKSCSYTFWPCHPLLNPLIYSIVFILVSIPFYCFQCNSSMPSYMVCSFNSRYVATPLCVGRLTKKLPKQRWHSSWADWLLRDRLRNGRSSNLRIHDRISAALVLYVLVLVLVLYALA